MSDGEFVTQREFDRTIGIIERSIETGQRRTDDELRRVGDALTALAGKIPPLPTPQQAEHTALGMHDVAKAVRDAVATINQAPVRTGGVPWRFLSLAVLAVCGVLVMGMTKGHMW